MSADEMKPFLVSFLDRRPGCIMATTTEAAMTAAKEVAQLEPVGAAPLPFPCHPYLGTPSAPLGVTCKEPANCAGHNECQRAGKRCGE